jgi:hypothetical protein
MKLFSLVKMYLFVNVDLYLIVSAKVSLGYTIFPNCCSDFVIPKLECVMYLYVHIIFNLFNLMPEVYSVYKVCLYSTPILFAGLHIVNN